MDFAPPESTTLHLDLLHCDPHVRPRELLDPERVSLYADLYREEGPDALPPVVAFYDDETYWIADGFHRVAAAHVSLSAGKSVDIPVALYRGNQRDAMLFACGANATHGLSLSSRDKRLVIRRILEDPETGQWSARRIARFVGASAHTVLSVRDELASVQNAQIQPGMAHIQTTTIHPIIVSSPPVTTTIHPIIVSSPPINRTASVRVIRGGTEYAMHTDNIGQRQSAAPTDEPTSTPAPTEAPTSTPHAPQDATTQGLEALHTAWKAANSPARCEFLRWANTQPLDDVSASGVAQ